MSIVVRECIGFALLYSVIGPENLRHSLYQSDIKLKPILTWLLAFSHSIGKLYFKFLLALGGIIPHVRKGITRIYGFTDLFWTQMS